MQKLSVFILCALCAGCAPIAGTRFADEAPPPDTSGWNKAKLSDDLKDAMKEVVKEREKYFNHYKAKYTIQTGFDSTLIGVATATLSAAFFGASKDVVGGLGIGAGSLSTYRSYYDPEKEGQAYLKGYQGMRCITTAASFLQNADPDALQLSITSLRDKIAKTQNAKKQDAATTSAIDAAKSALAAAEREISAYNQAPLSVRLTADGIAKSVEIAMHRSSPDISQMGNNINIGLRAASESAASAAEARTKWAQAIKDTTTGEVLAKTKDAKDAAREAVQLTSDSSTILANLPMPPYSEIVANITSCGQN